MVNQLSDILQLIKNSFVLVLHNISSLCMSTKVLFNVNVKKLEILSILDMVIEWAILFVTLKAWHQNEWMVFVSFRVPCLQATYWMTVIPGGLSDWQYIEWTLEQLGCVS